MGVDAGRRLPGYGAAVASLVPSCVWRVTSELIVALDERFGDPVDCYVNGSQTWLRDDGPGNEAIEWRLHPVPGYATPAGLSHYDVFPTVALAASGMGEGPSPTGLWDGLEAFPAYGDELEPAPLASALARALGVPVDASGLVDHDRVADDWEQAAGMLSITEALLAQLAPT